MNLDPWADAAAEQYDDAVNAHLCRVAAALSDLGPGAAAAGASAALVHGWALVDLPLLPRIAVPLNHGHLWHPDADLIRCRLADGDVSPAGRLRLLTTSPARTMRDVARDLPLADAVAVIDSAVRQDEERLEAWRDHANRLRGPYSGRTRRALQLADIRAESPLESLGRVPLVLAGIGPLELQQRLVPGGHPYDGRVGAGADLLLEWDGDLHRGRGRFLLDLDHGLEALDGGLLLLRTGWPHVRRQTRDYVAFVDRLVQRQRARPRRRSA